MQYYFERNALSACCITLLQLKKSKTNDVEHGSPIGSEPLGTREFWIGINIKNFINLYILLSGKNAQSLIWNLKR